MLERSESSLHIPTPAPRVVEVIADFAAYPEWAHGVREARVLSTEGDGWPDRVHFDVVITSALGALHRRVLAVQPVGAAGEMA